MVLTKGNIIRQQVHSNKIHFCIYVNQHICIYTHTHIYYYESKLTPCAFLFFFHLPRTGSKVGNPIKEGKVATNPNALVDHVNIFNL